MNTLDQFTQLIADASLWGYAVVFVFAAFDALVPIVPSETAVITAGVMAATGHLTLLVVILAAFFGAWGGDNSAYLLGRRFGASAQRRFFSGAAGRRRRAWATRNLSRRGGELITVARFVPGGRTAVTLTAGTLRYPWARFAVFDALAALVWALYASMLGYLGGRAFARDTWKGLLLALGVAFGVVTSVELVRRLHR